MVELMRLKKRREFVHIANHGYKIVTYGMIVQACPTIHSDMVRVGFTVTKKTGGAVQRNRIRRRLREVVRLQMPRHAVTGIDYVFIGRKAAVDRPFDLLEGDIRYAMRQLRNRLAEKNISTEVVDATK